MTVALALAAGWFALFAFAHVLLFRLGLVGTPSGALVRAAAVALVGAAASALALTGSPVLALDGAVAVFCLLILYVPAYYVAATSQSVQLLIALDRAGGALPLERVAGRPVLGELVRRRLEAMVASGMLARAGDRYTPTPRGRRTAAMWAGLKRLWKLGPGG